VGEEETDKTTGTAPRGRISPHTLSFLGNMKDPEKNDRDWFARHKNVSSGKRL